MSSPFYVKHVKCVFDRVVAFTGLLLLSPMLAGIAFMVRFRLGRPVLFHQRRPGYKGKPFRMYKFRTMTEERDPCGMRLPDDQRLTRLGIFLRSTSLDELPELINVVKGDMSIVGPRPLLMRYLPLYSPEQARRHEARPGLTGWAQVNGRNAISWEEKFALDVWYADNRSFALDMKILAMTVWKVLGRKGISAEGEATMPEFMGTVSPGGKSGNA